MRRTLRQSICILITIFCVFSHSSAQDQLNQPNLRLYLSDDKSSYAGMVMVNQIWSKYVWNNPDVNGLDQKGDFDFGLRRSRLILYTYLMDKVFIYTQIGTDGISFKQKGNPSVSLYNAQTEYILSKNKLHLGFGLNTWNGISRYNNCKLLEFLVVDNPGFAYPVPGAFDRFGRQMGVYARGNLNKLNYRVSVAKPFYIDNSENLENTTTERPNSNMAVKGYFSWQFFDKENDLMPYMTMNNLGRARLFNIGAGFYHHPDAMTENWDDNLKVSDITLWALDMFLDMPLANNGAITSFLGYYNYNFGKNYLRSMGKMNSSTANIAMALAQGTGNSEWEIGSGQIVRGEIGYLFPHKILNARLQPFGAFSYKNFEALDESSVQFDLGMNIFQYMHNIKWTLQYSTRPVYETVNGAELVSDYKGMLILQTHISF